MFFWLKTDFLNCCMSSSVVCVTVSSLTCPRVFLLNPLSMTFTPSQSASVAPRFRLKSELLCG